MNVKSYDLTKAAHYHTGKFPPRQLDYEQIAPALVNASASLARYDAKMASMVNSSLLLAPLQRQDAISSSRMEGTFSTMEDLYRLEAEETADGADPHTEARDDDIETYLYSRALRLARAALAAGSPLSEYLIKSAHQTLLAFGRGAKKRSGAYKIEQNYIGDERTGTVYYVPISPEQLPPAMETLVAYMGNDQV